MQKILLAIATTAFLNIVAFAAAAWPVMLLWNSQLVLAIGGLSEINYFQTIGIMFLVHLMFKSSVSITSKV